MLLVTVTRHRLALGHLQSHSAWSFVGHDLLGDQGDIVKVLAANGGTCCSASSFNTPTSQVQGFAGLTGIS